jgi:uncharacterized protein
MIIHFNEIPEGGKNYQLNQHSGELNRALKDLIGERAYSIEMDVFPLGQSFDVKGVVYTKLPQVCSLCADEFDLELREKFHHIVMNQENNTVSGFKEDWSSEDVEVWTTKEEGEFDVGELIHEVVALAQPTRPVCKADCKGLCLMCGEDLNVTNCNCAEQQKVETSPFSVLKQLKLN